MENKEIIKKARERFDPLLHTEHYKEIHSDSKHLENLIRMIEIKKGKTYLDLGTGNGYIAFELAGREKNIKVIGLDIAENSILKNIEIKEKNEIKNIEFVKYEGTRFPFEQKSISGIISRYAFHHFPDPDLTIAELFRILEDKGFFILSDPMTDEIDEYNFIDRFQSVQEDGHVHFYRRSEIEEYFKKHNFRVEKEFYSSIRYPREVNENYKKLFMATDREILDKYEITQENGKVYVKVKVMNILFRKNKEQNYC